MRKDQAVTVEGPPQAGMSVTGTVPASQSVTAKGAAHPGSPRSSVEMECDRAWLQHRSGQNGARRPQVDGRKGAPAAYGALDLGTNNCRLLIARPAADGFKVIDAFSRIVRLGEGLGTAGVLGEAAMDRALDALRICAQKLELRAVQRSRLVATEACRAAGNGEAFVERVRSEIGLDLEIVDQKTEAALAVTGCAALADPEADGIIVFDIGGGSTEIVWLDGCEVGAEPARRIRHWTSLPIGVVTMAERYGGIAVSAELFQDMVAAAGLAMRPFADIAGRACEASGFHLLGTSGTVTTVAGIHLGLERYDRRLVDGLWMRDDDVTRVMDALVGMDFTARAANPCIGTDRADLVLAGCAIFEAIRRVFPSPRIRIADRGLREGILMQMMLSDGIWPCGAR